MPAAACNSKVLFPIPGSPPSKLTEPATNPPPRTRSNSTEPVENRATSGASIAESGNASTTLGRPAACEDNRTLAGTSSISTRSKASQVPQSGHFPAQVGCVDPHSVQRKVCFGAFGPDFGITNPFLTSCSGINHKPNPPLRAVRNLKNL